MRKTDTSYAALAIALCVSACASDPAMLKQEYADECRNNNGISGADYELGYALTVRCADGTKLIIVGKEPKPISGNSGLNELATRAILPPAREVVAGDAKRLF